MKAEGWCLELKIPILILSETNLQFFDFYLFFFKFLEISVSTKHFLF